jgi:lysyl-tRNA synthetase class I
MTNQQVPTEKMLEMVRRLTLGTQKDTVDWTEAAPGAGYNYYTEIADHIISIKVSEQFGEVLVRVSDKRGRLVASADSATMKDASQRTDFQRLFQEVRRKAGGAITVLDDILAHLPEEPKRQQPR